MKTIYLLIICVFLSFISIYAQDEMPVEITQRETSMGMQSGFMITIKNANLKTVTKEWEKEIKNSKFTDILKKSDAKVQFKHQGDEYIAENATIQTISSDPITVIATISDIQGGIRFIAFIMHDSVFISRDNTKEETFLAAKNYVRSFGIESLKNVVAASLAEEQNILKNLEKGLDKLISNKESYEKEISSDSSDIREINNQIKCNIFDQEKQRGNVQMAKDTLYNFDKKSEDYKTFKSKLKEEQRSMKKLIKTNKSLHLKIKKFELAIDKAYDNIQTNIREQGEQKDLIYNQKTVVTAIEEHLKNIK